MTKKRIEAMAFANWLALEKYYSIMPTDEVTKTKSIMWRNRGLVNGRTFTTGELYDLFIKTLKAS